jgi:GntR family transcriptional regulator, transcriptional repressor for pyruvate dehydrogenase complex
MRTIANSSKNVQASLSVDRAFHDTIAKITGNIIVRGVMRNVHASLSDGWCRSQLTGEDLGLVVEQHAQIAAGIKSRNPAAARRAMEAHVRWAAEIETDRIEQAASSNPGVRPAVPIRDQ